MKTGKFNFEEMAKSFDEVERKLEENAEGFDVEAFFKDFHEKFDASSGVEKHHILEVRKRIKKILEIIENLKKDLIAKKVALVENQKKFSKYSKASVLKNK